MPRTRPTGLVLALPLLVGAGLQPGTCGSILDYNTIDIVLEPVDRMSVTSEEGFIKTLTFDRNGVRLWKHTYGYQASLGREEHWVEDDTLFVYFDCKAPADCYSDQTIELPLGTAIDLDLQLGDIELGAADSDVTVAVDIGEVLGLELTSPKVAITAGESLVDLTFAAAPESVEIAVDDGGVVLDLPAGAYRCDFTVDEGEQTLDGVTCDDAAAASLTVTIARGDLTVHAS